LPPIGTLTLHLSVTAAGWSRLPAARSVARRAGRAAFRHVGRAVRAEASVLLADDAELRRLNREWRGKDAATNVLAFQAVPADGAGGRGGPPVALGDIAVALETVAREAIAQRKAPCDHLAHMIVHGMLHLLGRDHRRPAEAARMEAEESAIMVALGLPDPWRDGESAGVTQMAGEE
jgi:probable rRNA maturation factor